MLPLTHIDVVGTLRLRLATPTYNNPRRAVRSDLRLSADVDAYPHVELGKLASFLSMLEHITTVSALAHSLVLVLVLADPVFTPSMNPRRR